MLVLGCEPFPPPYVAARQIVLTAGSCRRPARQLARAARQLARTSGRRRRAARQIARAAGSYRRTARRPSRASRQTTRVAGLTALVVVAPAAALAGLAALADAVLSCRADHRRPRARRPRRRPCRPCRLCAPPPGLAPLSPLPPLRAATGLAALADLPPLSSAAGRAAPLPQPLAHTHRVRNLAACHLAVEHPYSRNAVGPQPVHEHEDTGWPRADKPGPASRLSPRRRGSQTSTSQAPPGNDDGHPARAAQRTRHGGDRSQGKCPLRPRQR